ncbi:bacterio-opsin activator domain-containing protein [Natronorubrum thiooxidans]|uniref:PAS domain S-box-containing protein n=1 Tax=Natronorubrum thiooxidans TaxID=308853 RepID=A0A1N7FIT6_9EURY|nr:bacterio-opsin activator domain-containing protein [Natronorubrum thiooxidans]SIS00155.1 PAS domain S-box-containing protein [Natronorubrum thiooxidans]
MPHETRPGPILHVTTADSSSLKQRLRTATSFDVRSDSPETVLETMLDSEVKSAPENRAEDGSTELAGIVLELECTERTKTVLERINTEMPAVPTVVVPLAGSEALAAAAVRTNADDYVQPDRDDDPVERVLEAIHSNQTGAAETRPIASAVDTDYHRILANELPDEAFVISADGTYLETSVRPDVADLGSISADELTGNQLEDVFPDDVATELQACIDRTLATGDTQSIEYSIETTDGRRQYEGRVVPIDDRIGGARAVVWLARDITERVQRERELRSQRNQLETLNKINAVIGQVIETLVEARSRDAIEHEVCDQLVDSDLYCGSWIAEHTGDRSLRYRTGAGSATADLERVTDAAVDQGWLAQRAVETGTIQTQTGISENETVPDPLRDGARDAGVRSAIAVPIRHNESIYGVLTVFSGREEAFSEGERAGFELLGETIGFTIMAVRNRQLLFADAVIELEFRIDGGDTFSFDLSEEYDCTCSLEWAGTTSNGRTVQYITIEGIDCETVLEAATAHDSVEECRRIHHGADCCTIEMSLSESGVRALANHGATIREITVKNGVGTCLVEVSQDADVREIADTLTGVYENTELVARREVDRPVRTATERCSRILDQLTERQLTTLRLAYYGGFFDWPRESTGEEVAETMDISPPTMHQHLRKGLKTVLKEFFEIDSRTEQT